MRRQHVTAQVVALACLALGCGPAPDEAPSPAPEPAVVGETDPVSAPAPRVGLWVLCEGSQRVLENPERVETLLRDARSLGASDLFVQVYRGGRAWFDSSFADPEPYRRAAEIHGADPLADLIERAHAAGLRVHAWVNVLSLAGNRDAPILRDLGPGVVHVDRQGRSILDYPELDVPPPAREWVRMGTPAVWLDPGVPGVAERLTDTFAELVIRYPGLDGLHLDYIRFPDVLPFSPGARFRVGVDFGYSEASRARFSAETGLPAPTARGGGVAAWDDWRRGLVTGLVSQIRGATRAVSPQLEISAAVTAYPERAYLSLFQDWRGWLDAGLLDFAVVMLYTRDETLLRYEASAYVGGVGGDRVWLGLGSWLFAAEPARAVGQRRFASSLAPAGIALFSWDSIADQVALREALARDHGG